MTQKPENLEEVIGLELFKEGAQFYIPCKVPCKYGKKPCGFDASTSMERQGNGHATLCHVIDAQECPYVKPYMFKK